MLLLSVVSLLLLIPFHATHAMLADEIPLTVKVESPTDKQRLLVLNTIHTKDSWLPVQQDGWEVQDYEIDQHEDRRLEQTPNLPDEIKEFDRAVMLYSGDDLGNKGPLWFLNKAFELLDKQQLDVVCFAGSLPEEHIADFLEAIHKNVSKDGGTQFCLLRQHEKSGLHAVAQTLIQEGYPVHEVALYRDEEFQGDCNLWRKEYTVRTMLHRAYAKVQQGAIPYNKDYAHEVDAFVDKYWNASSYYRNFGIRFTFIVLAGASFLTLYSISQTSAKDTMPGWVVIAWLSSVGAIPSVPLLLEIMRSIYLRTQY